MRTVKIEDKEQLISFLKTQAVCYMGVASKDGVPYVVPMNFGVLENEVILHSGPEGRLIDVLKENQKVCLTFCEGDKLKWQDEHVACSYRVDSMSVVVEGELNFVEDLEEKRIYLDALMKNYSDREFKYSEPALRNVTVMAVPIEIMQGRRYGVPTHIAKKLETVTVGHGAE